MNKNLAMTESLDAVPETPRFSATEEANLIGYGEGYCAGYADGLRERVKDFEAIYAACLTGDVFSIPTLMLETLKRWGMSGSFVGQLERLVQRQISENDAELAALRRQYADMCDRAARAEAALKPFADAYRMLTEWTTAEALTLYAGVTSHHVYLMNTSGDDDTPFLGGEHLKAAHDVLAAEGVIEKAVSE